MSHQPFHDSSSLAKVIISNKTTKCCAIFLGSNLILVDLYCFRDYSSSVYSCSTFKDIVAVRLLIPTADAKVARLYTKRTILAWKIFLSTGSERISHTSPARFKPMLFSKHQQRG